jgi:peroxiredoxin
MADTVEGGGELLQNGIESQKFGEPLPDLFLADLKGRSVGLGSRLAGKKGGVVVFWSSTCSHCVRYDGYLNSFEANHPGLALIVVAARSGETLAGVQKAAAQRDLRFTLVHDGTAKAAGAWYTQQTPRAFLMDPDRKLLYRGAIDNYKFAGDSEHVDYLEPAIAEFLSGAEITRPETASFGCAIQSVYYTLPKAL